MYFVKFGVLEPVSNVDTICESPYFPYTAEVRPDWAPHGTLRFLELAAAGANLNVIVIQICTNLILHAHANVI